MTIRHEQAARGSAPPDAGRAGNVVPLPQHAPERRSDAAAPAVEPLWRQVVGRQLRAERTARGDRIADVAQRAGVAPQYLSELERGIKDGSSEILAAVSGALGLTVLELARRASLQPARGLFRGNDGPVCLAA